MKAKKTLATVVALMILVTVAPAFAQEGPAAMTPMQFCGGYWLSVPSDWYLWRVCDTPFKNGLIQSDGVAFLPNGLSQHRVNVNVTSYRLSDLGIVGVDSTEVIAELFQVHLWEVGQQNGYPAIFVDAISADGLFLVQGVFVITDQDALVLVVVELEPEEIAWMDEAYEIVHSFEYRPSK